MQTDRFFEGAWAGSFEEMDFQRAECFGSGAIVDANGITFTPPDHILERLHIHRTDTVLTISNSLPMVMSRTNVTCDVTRSDYHVLLGRIIRGLDHHTIKLPMANDQQITLWHWHHLHIDTDLQMTKRTKDRRTRFADYADYTSYISGCMARIFENAASDNRKERFDPIGTISSGYDSTAITALANDHGCTEAITFPQSRGALGREAEDDSGAEASQVLGLNVHLVDRLSYRTHSGLPEIDGYGAGSELLSARDLLNNRVLMTGFLGDTMWDREPGMDASYLVIPTIAGHNLGEMRLTANFLMFPVPFLGCQGHADIVKISQSEDMRPWAMQNDYDRPICRRIAEDRGVPRASFGVKKKAAGVYFREEGLSATMTPLSYEDYESYRLENTGVSLPRANFADRRIVWLRFANRILRKISKGIPGVQKSIQLDATPGITTQGALLFQWSLHHLVSRYDKK